MNSTPNPLIGELLGAVSNDEGRLQRMMKMRQQFAVPSQVALGQLDDGLMRGSDLLSKVQNLWRALPTAATFMRR